MKKSLIIMLFISIILCMITTCVFADTVPVSLEGSTSATPGSTVTVTYPDGTKTTVSSDSEFQAAINASLKAEATMKAAAENSKKLETILVNGKFKVESFLTAGANTASNYKDYTVDFANNLSVTAASVLAP